MEEYYLTNIAIKLNVLMIMPPKGRHARYTIVIIKSTIEFSTYLYNMKFRTTILFLFTLSVMHCQIEWQEIDEIKSSNVDLKYVSKNGTLFGIAFESIDLSYSQPFEAYALNPKPKHFVFSVDYGINWESIDFEDFFWHENLDHILIRENSVGEIFLAVERYGDVVYELDLENTSLIEFIQLENSLRDFDFYRSDEIVVLTDDNLNLFSKEGVLINLQEVNTHKARLKIGANELHFLTYQIGASEFLRTFNSNLSQVSESINVELDFPYSILKSIVYNEKLCVPMKGYTSDGLEWQSYSFNNEIVQPSNLAIDSLGRLVLFDETSLYSGNLTNFEKVLIPNSVFSFLNYHVIYHQTPLGWIMKLTDDYAQNRAPFRIVSADETFQEINPILNHFGIPYLLDVEAGSNGLVLGRDSKNDFLCFVIGEGLKYLQKSAFQYQSSNREFHLTKVNSLLTNVGLFSDNFGDDWQQVGPEYVRNYFYKNNKYYYSNLNESSIFISNDFGKSFNRKEVSIPNTFHLIHYLSLNKVIGIENSISYIIDMETSQKTEIELIIPASPVPGYSIADKTIESSNDGSKIFQIINDSYSDFTPMFRKSEDFGESFSEMYLDELIGDNFQIKVDHRDNIYLFSAENIWSSYDFGDSWTDITPTNENHLRVNDIAIGYDNYIYLATTGHGILKSPTKIVNSVTEKLIPEMTLFPNPVTNYLKLELNQSRNYILKVLNSEGVVVLTSTNAKGSINVENLKEGLYYLNIIFLDKASHNSCVAPFFKAQLR